MSGVKRDERRHPCVGERPERQAAEELVNVGQRVRLHDEAQGHVSKDGTSSENLMRFQKRFGPGERRINKVFDEGAAGL